MKSENQITEFTVLEAFPDDYNAYRTAEDIVEKDEFEAVYKQLLHLGYETEAHFYRFLYFTGCRFGEAIGISLIDIKQGNISSEKFHETLDRHGIIYHGYINLMSQPDNPNKSQRGKNGCVKRKPLKGKKAISAKYARTIPIEDKELWNILVVRAQEQIKKYKQGKYGLVRSDYLLFDGIDKTTAAARLRKAFEAAGYTYKTWHLLRHTRGTELYSNTWNKDLCKVWLGHTSDKVFERYNHAHELMVTKDKENQFEELFDLKIVD